jgi:misacylated tRNA(Ala) deacylase
MTEELFRQDAYLTSCEAKVTAVSEGGIVLDRTVFYPLGGGQPGDHGVLEAADGRRVVIADTRKGDGQDILHVPHPDTPPLAVGDTVRATIDWNLRHRHMRMHTCLHLLCSLVDAGVTGGAVGADRGRLDFDLPEPTIDKASLTEGLNALIQRDLPVGARWISDQELAEQPDLVRTMSVQPPSGGGSVRLIDIPEVDLQPCGGTHVARTGEIGAVQISKIEKKSRHNRRVVVSFVD